MGCIFINYDINLTLYFYFNYIFIIKIINFILFYLLIGLVVWWFGGLVG